MDLQIWKSVAVRRRNRLEKAIRDKQPRIVITQLQRITEKARRKVKALENEVFLVGEIE